MFAVGMVLLGVWFLLVVCNVVTKESGMVPILLWMALLIVGASCVISSLTILAWRFLP